MVDVSEKGCKIAVPPELPRARDLRIQIKDHPLQARVAWRDEYFAGIEFEESLPSHVLKRLKP